MPLMSYQSRQLPVEALAEYRSPKQSILPEFRFEVADSAVTLYNTEVIKNAESGSQLFAGSLGADFVLSFRRLVINYQNMFVRGVK